jgi:hypothetical protein
MLALAWVGLMGARVLAGPGLVQSSGPYDVSLPNGGGHYLISDDVYFNGPGYTYTYTIESLNDTTHTFELGLASQPYFWGKYTETDPQVDGSPGTLLHDLVPHTTNMPWLGRHNYVFTELTGNTRTGIPIGPGETRVLSFNDGHAPVLSRWSLREYIPFVQTRNFAALHAGKFAVPSAPEPTSLALASVGIAGIGLSALRRRKALTTNV